MPFAYKAITSYGTTFQSTSAKHWLFNSLAISQFASLTPLHPYRNGCVLSHDTGLGCSDFARRYSRNRFALFSSGY